MGEIKSREGPLTKWEAWRYGLLWEDGQTEDDARPFNKAPGVYAPAYHNHKAYYWADTDSETNCQVVPWPGKGWAWKDKDNPTDYTVVHADGWTIRPLVSRDAPLESRPKIERNVKNFNAWVTDNLSVFINPNNETEGKGMETSSGWRSPRGNIKAGGVKGSYHEQGLAMDFVPKYESLQDKLSYSMAVAAALFNSQSRYPDLREVLLYTDTGHIHIAAVPGVNGKVVFRSTSKEEDASFTPLDKILKEPGHQRNASILFGDDAANPEERAAAEAAEKESAEATQASEELRSRLKAGCDEIWGDYVRKQGLYSVQAARVVKKLGPKKYGEWSRYLEEFYSNENNLGHDAPFPKTPLKIKLNINTQQSYFTSLMKPTRDFYKADFDMNKHKGDLYTKAKDGDIKYEDIPPNCKHDPRASVMEGKIISQKIRSLVKEEIRKLFDPI
jgi:hypothetical protein